MWRWEVLCKNLITGEQVTYVSEFCSTREVVVEYLESWLHINLPKMTFFLFLNAEIVYISEKDIDAEYTIL